MTQRSAARHRTAVLALLLLLPLGGCAGGTPVAPTPADAAPSGSAPAVEPSAGPPPPSPARSAPARPAPARPAPARSVPTVRATLEPAVEVAAPVRLVARDVGIDLPVGPYGVDADGFMRLPDTVQEVAWYAYGPRPGDRAGSTVLAAHVDTVEEGLGPFADLRDLDEGDELRVTDADRRVWRYAVASVEEVAKAEVPLDRVFRRDGDPALVVITCGGSFQRGRGYSDNVVVTARPLG
jgi:pyruvate/2-oxoglutarate dehydrogenase complex dihydrolipoamide acyltransferase (E2) component